MTALQKSNTAGVLFESLLGGATAAGDDPAAERVVQSGIPALPETLVFAGWLAANASSDAAEFQAASFEYSGQSSSPTDAVATQIQGMVKQVQAFLNAMSEHSSEKGIMRIRKQVDEFIEGGEVALQQLVKKQVERTFDALESSTPLSLTATRSLVDDAVDIDDAQSAVAASWGQLQEMLASILGKLPTCINNLKNARKGVSAVSALLDSSFESFGNKGPHIFHTAARSYAAGWILYYFLLSIFSLSLLYYAFWASGFLGDQASRPDEADNYAPPTTLVERLRTFCRSSCHGLSERCSGELCFWSFLLAAQFGVLLLFLVTLLLCVLAGVNAFLASGCAEIYAISDAEVCTDTLKMLKAGLGTFGVHGTEDIDNACVEQTLLTCEQLGPRMKAAALLTCGGGLFGAVFSFQILVDSAVLHERMRMQQLVKALSAPGGGSASRLADS